MKTYLSLLSQILEQGEKREDRTGTGTLSIFGHQSHYDMTSSFPLLTTKKLHMRSIIHELLWFLSGDTNIDYLKKHQVRIWDEWADENGDLGPVYGFQWRHWGQKWRPSSHRDSPGAVALDPRGGIDQIANVIQSIRNNPQSRRHIVSAWNVTDVQDMALPPCHTMFQFYVHEDGRLSCQLYQRSADVFLGVPFNIASYALLTAMVAAQTGLTPGKFVHTIGDAHLYLNHIEQAQEQLRREPRTLPKLTLNPDVKSIFDYRFEDITITGYDPHPTIKAEISV